MTAICNPDLRWSAGLRPGVFETAISIEPDRRPALQFIMTHQAKTV